MERFRIFLVLSVFALAGASGGCILPFPTDATVLVLEYSMTPHGSEQDHGISPGHHCGTASLRGDVLEVQEWAYESAGGSGRFLFIDPAFGQGAASGDSQPFVSGFPANVSLGWHADQPWAVIDLDAEGLVRIDGKAVELPRTWSTRQGSWQIDAMLREGPSQVKVVPDQMCM